jgi:hypothetical protein
VPSNPPIRSDADAPDGGDADRPRPISRSGPSRSKVGANPIRGVRGPRPRSTRPARGASARRRAEPGGDTPGDPVKRRTAKSSTLGGPRGLAGESHGRRCRIANTRRRWVRGRFPVRSPEIATTSGGNWLRPGGRCHGGGVPGVTPGSDVTRETGASANAGRSGAAGFGQPVPGVVTRVVQTFQTGSVA